MEADGVCVALVNDGPVTVEINTDPVPLDLPGDA